MSSKKKPEDKKERTVKPYAVTLKSDLAERVDSVAEVLGMDPTTFIRHVFISHFPEYEQKAMGIQKHEEEFAE